MLFTITVRTRGTNTGSRADVQNTSNSSTRRGSVGR